MVANLQVWINRRYAVIAGTFLTAIWIWVALDRPYVFPTHTPWSNYSNLPLSVSPGHKPGAPPLDIFDFPVVDSESIRSICGEAKWNQSLVFTCDKSVGGVGNIRNSILNCVRYAISAGASLVIPSIVLRNASDISQIRTGVTTDLSYMFDTPHFFDSLRLSCPGLKIHKSRSDIEGYVKTRDAISLEPESLVDPLPATGLPEPAAWRGQFYSWLQQYSTPTVPGAMVVDLQRSYLRYPIYSDGDGFALTFGSILKFRTDARIVAAKTVQNLVDIYAPNVNITQEILPNLFFGAHLRTEKDAVEGWPAPDWVYSRFETQSRLYLEQAPRSNSSVIYVASGDLKEVANFAHDASQNPNNYTVITKFDLLQGPDLKELQSLKWDQQGLVDYLVMLKASDFAGVAHSSFAWNIALKRHIHAKQKKHLDGPQMMSDERSQIYGSVRGYPEYAACLWP